jgi:hypothetical protein
MSRKPSRDYGASGRSAASQPAHSRVALNVHVLAPLAPAVAWMPSANSNFRAPVSTTCDIPFGEVRVADDELTLMQPTSIAFCVVVVTSGRIRRTLPRLTPTWQACLGRWHRNSA